MIKSQLPFCSLINQNFYSEQQLARAFVYSDYSIEKHWHDFYEINVVLSGNGTHIIENRSFATKKGDVFIIPPNIIHSYENTEALDVLHIIVKPLLFEKRRSEHLSVKGFELFTQIEPFLRNNYDETFFLHLSDANLSLLGNDISLIKDGGFCDKLESEALKNQIVIKLIYWFSLLLYSQIHKDQEKSDYSEQFIIKALEFIHENYSQKITIDTLCKQTRMSRATLMRKFKLICGVTPMQYVNNYRKEKAKELLLKQKLTKTEIAYECGFYDLSHMDKVLKN